MADMLSQEEIDALLGGDDEASGDNNDNANGEAFDLSKEDKDVLGEVGNISMGTSATTLSSLLNQRVLITTPRVSVVKWAEVSKNYDKPCVGVRVNYVEGIDGANIMILKHRDVKVITNLMFGGDGTIDEEEEINDIDLSAIAESMNQMVGSSSTSLAQLVGNRVDIDTPVAFVIDFDDPDIVDNIGFDQEYAVCIAFRMQIGDLIDSEIMQLLPMKLAEDLVNVVRADLKKSAEAPPQGAAPQGTAPPTPNPPQEDAMNNQPQQAAPPMNPQAPPPGYGYPPPQPTYAPPQYTAQPAQFQNFDPQDLMQQKENIEIIMDVPLEVTVELGRTTRKIREILEFSPGSIIELNKLAGEPIDILVNSKFVAKGEVVVIDENFGIRITSIIHSEFRI